MIQNLCKNCKYFGMTEEYWHDHYLIQSHSVCYQGPYANSYYNRHDVDPNGCCELYEYCGFSKDEETTR